MAEALALDAEVRFVRGVGPNRARELARLGVRTVGDLLEYYPFRHELIPKSQPIGTMKLGAVATLIGTLQRVRDRNGHGGLSATAEIVDGTGRCRLRWFHTPYLVDKLRTGDVVRVTGKVDAGRDLALLTNPDLTVLDEGDPLAEDHDRYEPVYSATAGLSSRQIGKVIGGILDQTGDAIAEFLPENLRKSRGLPPRRTAVIRYHVPTTPSDVAVARKRLAYEELLLCQLGVQMSRRAALLGPKAKPIKTTEEMDRRIRARFPFALTSGQNRAAAEIRADLARSTPMNRLLQADVGAGKTAVAVYAALAAVANKRQAAILAPTEVLADQHRRKVGHYLSGSKVRIGYLAGSTPKAKRPGLLRSLAVGEIDLLIGTHALFEADVRFHDLGLVIIDEQHKFGVAQRAALRSKGTAPHTLVLTATPIPRTLAMTVFGDLDVSTIDCPPPNRQPVVTRLVTPDLAARAWSFLRSRLEKGEQAYIVYPLVEESDEIPLKAASAEVKNLGESLLSGFEIGLLHGRIPASQKAALMGRFREGEVRVLVSTTVIEVGVDVPNATVMVVQHADRYGLSQLHQLRGRIGRGSKKSYCLLFSDAQGDAPRERLGILCATNDGFRIAEEDLRLRGPGELLGTRQHGIPAFKVADLIGDFALLEHARDDAAALLRSDPILGRREHVALRQQLSRRFAETMRLIDVA